MSYVGWLELEGTLETVEEINAAVYAETDGCDPETDPFFDPDADTWRDWIEHANGKTYVIAELDGPKDVEEHEKRYGKMRCYHGKIDL